MESTAVTRDTPRVNKKKKKQQNVTIRLFFTARKIAIKRHNEREGEEGRGGGRDVWSGVWREFLNAARAKWTKLRATRHRRVSSSRKMSRREAALTRAEAIEMFPADVSLPRTIRPSAGLVEGKREKEREPRHRDSHHSDTNEKKLSFATLAKSSR